jgi:hypothetical protein
MVLEMMVEINGGQGYTNIFARTGADPSTGWQLMDPSTFKYAGGTYGHTATGSYDYGDPTIRYLPSDGHYYIVPATPYQKWGHARVLPGIYPCCFTQVRKAPS